MVRVGPGSGPTESGFNNVIGRLSRGTKMRTVKQGIFDLVK